MENSQKIKYPIRSEITAPKGKVLISADLSQAEAWVVAYLANEPTMKLILGTGLIHELSARIIFDLTVPQNLTDVKLMKEGVSKDQRFLGKKMNHSCNYRTGPFMITTMINKESDKPPFVTVTIKEAKLFHKRWHGFFNITIWWNDIERQLGINRTLITPYRRKRVFYSQWGDSLFKEATAYIPQSTVGDHLFGCIQPEIGKAGGLLEITRKLVDNEIKIVNTSHDSCLVECPENTSKEIALSIKNYLLRPIMINGEVFTIPVDLEIGERWGELEKIL